MFVSVSVPVIPNSKKPNSPDIRDLCPMIGSRVSDSQFRRVCLNIRHVIAMTRVQFPIYKPGSCSVIPKCVTFIFNPELESHNALKWNNWLRITWLRADKRKNCQFISLLFFINRSFVGMPFRFVPTGCGEKVPWVKSFFFFLSHSRVSLQLIIDLLLLGFHVFTSFSDDDFSNAAGLVWSEWMCFSLSIRMGKHIIMSNVDDDDDDLWWLSHV